MAPACPLFLVALHPWAYYSVIVTEVSVILRVLNLLMKRPAMLFRPDRSKIETS